MSRQHKKKGISLKSFYIWHRYTGISAAILVIILSVTGLLLNHTEKFHLDTNYIDNPLLLDWYGIHAPNEIIAYHIENNWVSQLGEHIYLNNQRLLSEDAKLIGVTLFNEILVIALEKNIYLYTPEGELIENISEGVPSGMKNIGLSADGNFIIDAAHGTYVVDPDFLTWNERPVTAVEWIAPHLIPKEQKEKLQAAYRGEGLPQERFILDLHSGRIFGAYGLYIMDAAAIALLFLAFTGLYIWLQTRWKKRIHRKKQ